MTEQNEAEFDDYVNMIEKVLGRQSSSINDEESKQSFSNIDTQNFKTNSSDDTREDTENQESLDTIIQQVTQD